MKNIHPIMTSELQNKLTPSVILEELKKGNQRFLSKEISEKQIDPTIKLTAGGQWPMAAVLGCIDSRVPIETVLDLSIGDIFSARVAGNIVDEAILGSLEYACKVAGSKVILVLGHTSCGAVKSACDKVELGNITSLLSHIVPVVDAVPGFDENRNSSNSKFVAEVTMQNVLNTIERIHSESEILHNMAKGEDIMIVGGIYDVSTGEISFLT